MLDIIHKNKWDRPFTRKQLSTTPRGFVNQSQILWIRQPITDLVDSSTNHRSCGFVKQSQILWIRQPITELVDPSTNHRSCGFGRDKTLDFYTRATITNIIMTSDAVTVELYLHQPNLGSQQNCIFTRYHLHFGCSSNTDHDKPRNFTSYTVSQKNPDPCDMFK